VNIIEVEVNMD